MPQISIIAGIADNFAIGKDNDLPWSQPADLKHFKNLTTGHVVIMGRRTFESLPNGPLPNRKNIVLTSNPTGNHKKYQEAQSLKEAIDLCKNDEKIYIIGGARLFQEAINCPDVNTMHITWIHHNFDADVFFPTFNQEEWILISEEKHESDERNHYPYSFCEYHRK